MNITLILAAAEHDPLRLTDPFMPLSLPLLAAAAPGHAYTFVDMLAGETPDLAAPAELVGISARLTAERTAFELADAYRRRGVKVALGGPQISANPHAAAEHADAVAIGEGELLWPLIVADAQAGRLRRFYAATPRPFEARGLSLQQVPRFADLAREVHPPDRRPYRKRYAFDTVFAARGCPIDCEFCSVPALFGHALRRRPIEDVLREIDGFRGMFYLLDDTVFGRPGSYAYYQELYARLGGLRRRRLWTGQANLDAAASEEGREVIRRAARAGLVYAAIGIESIDPRVLARSGMIRKMGVETGEDALARMKEHLRFIQAQGIFVSGWFTLGHEEDDLGSVERTLAFAEELHLLPILCPLEALPGTRLHARLSREGRLDATQRVNIRHPTLSDEALLGAIERATRRAFSPRAVLRRSLHHTPLYGRDEPGAALRMRARMQRTLFTLVLQYHMRKGVIGLANDFR
ncbi:MAG TPA: radical SAM protein [Myxococcota bacterium]|nr:radical SAM protein [Myxococcota bacterium]HRY95978.1 radical SAM protein [Myxococcota bacterium]